MPAPRLCLQKPGCVKAFQKPVALVGSEAHPKHRQSFPGAPVCGRYSCHTQWLQEEHTQFRWGPEGHSHRLPSPATGPHQRPPSGAGISSRLLSPAYFCLRSSKERNPWIMNFKKEKRGSSGGGGQTSESGSPATGVETQACPQGG